MSPSNHKWLDREAGPVVRLYAVTQGRTRPAGAARLDLISVVVTTNQEPPDSFRCGPEHSRILDLCRRPTTVADLACDIDLPLGIVRVLLADLMHQDLIKVEGPPPQTIITDERLLRKVLDGLQAL